MVNVANGNALAELYAVRPKVIDLFSRFYPVYKGENEVFQRQVLGCLSKSDVVLDAGCGSGRMADHDFRDKARMIVGLDICDDLKANSSLTYAISGTLEDLPLREKSIDTILCRYVCEHLEKPERVFLEFARVLRNGGKLVLLTPNNWHYVNLMARLTPWWFHRWFNSSYGIAENDTFPTFHRANSPRRIKQLAEWSGMRVARMELLETSPNYLEFSWFLYLLGIGYERLVNRFSALSRFRVNIIATLQKPSASSM